MKRQRLVSVKDHKELKKDVISGAIINCDTEAFAMFMAQKEEKERNKDKIEYLENRINQLENLLEKVLNNQK